MKKDTGFIKLHNSTYNADTLVFVGETSDFIAQINRLFKLDGHDLEGLGNSIKGCIGFSTALECEGGTSYFMYLRDFDRENIKSVGTLAHEALHVAFFILSDRNVEVNPHGTTEEVNYLFTEIFESAMRRLCGSKAKSQARQGKPKSRN